MFLPIQPAKMKKVAEDKHSATFQHEDGHTIKIAKAGLSPEHRKMVSKLPLCSGGTVKMALGGIPEDAPQAGATASSPASRTDQGFGRVIIKKQDQDVPQMLADGGPPMRTAADMNPSGSSVDAPQEPSPPAQALPYYGQPPPAQAEVPPAPPEQQQVAPPSNPSIPQQTDEVQNSYDLGQQAIHEKQGVESQEAANRLSADNQDLAARQALGEDLQKNLKDFQTHQQLFMQDYMDNKINPRHYVESMSTTAKVATAIGMVLGGWNVGKANPAAEFLKSQIDRDIAAQQSNQEGRKTILEANQNLYHDQVMATNATRMNLNEITATKLRQAADKVGTPAAKAAADAASAHFGLENAQLLQQNAIRGTVLKALGQGGGQGLDPIDLGHAGLIPPEEATKESASLQAQKYAVNGAKNLFRESNQEQTAGNLINPQSYKRVNAINAELLNTVVAASASKRLTPQSLAHEIEPFYVKTGDTDETRQAKLNGVLNMIGKHADPTPFTARIAPKILPQYPGQAPAHPAGTTRFVNGKQVQVTK